MTIYWIDSGQLKLTCQIYDLGYETMITLLKANEKKIMKSNS